VLRGLRKWPEGAILPPLSDRRNKDCVRIPLSTAFLALAAVPFMVVGGCDGCGDCSSDTGSTRAGVHSSNGPAEASADASTRDATRSDTARTALAPDDEQVDADDANDVADGKRAADYPIEHLWAGYTYNGRVHIDLGAVLPFPGTERREVFDERERRPSAPYRADVIREPFRGTTEVDVLAPNGPMRLAFEEVRLERRGPDSDIGYELVTTSSESLKEAVPEVVLLAPAGEVAANASYRPAAPKPAHAKAVPNLRRGVIDALEPAVRSLVQKGSLDELSSELREELDYSDSVGYDTSAGLDARHFEVVEGEFPPPHTQFVAINGREGIDAVGVEFELVRAAFFATESGRVTEKLAVVHGPRYKWAHSAATRIKPLALIDLDADGIEGVLYELDGAIYWVDFANGHPVERRLD
jgi:hypothetical protein